MIHYVDNQHTVCTENTAVNLSEWLYLSSLSHYYLYFHSYNKMNFLVWGPTGLNRNEIRETDTCTASAVSKLPSCATEGWKKRCVCGTTTKKIYLLIIYLRASELDLCLCRSLRFGEQQLQLSTAPHTWQHVMTKQAQMCETLTLCRDSGGSWDALNSSATLLDDSFPDVSAWHRLWRPE